jgi:hypothetical protein
VDDDLIDGAAAYNVEIDPINSTELNYQGLSIAAVAVTNSDDDAAGFTITPTSLNTIEGGTPQTFTIRPNTDPGPGKTITVDITSGDTAEGTVGPATLSWTSANYQTARTVTVTPVEDTVADGPVAYDVSLDPIASTELNYQALPVQTVSVTNADNDTPGFTIIPLSLATSESGAAQTFTIRPNTNPGASTIQADITSTDTTEGLVSSGGGIPGTTTTLTWTSADYQTAKTVTVTPVNDFAIDGDVIYDVEIDAAASTDPGYPPLGILTVQVTNADDDGTPDSPTISAIANKTTPTTVTLQYILFTADEGTGPGQDGEVLSVVDITSSNQNVIPNGNISYTFDDNGNGGSGEITIVPGAAGIATITLIVTDGTYDSQTTFNVTVVTKVSPPTAYNLHASTKLNTLVAIKLAAKDLINGAHTISSWKIDKAPLHGTLTGTAPNLTYTPASGFTGYDQFTYYATDLGAEASNLAIVNIVVQGSTIFIVGNAATVIAGTGPTADVAVKNALNGMGLTPTIIDDDDVFSGVFDITTIDLVDEVIISSSVVPTNISGSPYMADFRDSTTPIMTWERFLYDDLKMVASEGATDQGNTGSTRNVVIANTAHPLTGGLSSGSKRVLSSSVAMVWGNVAGFADVGGTVTVSSVARPVIFGYDEGDMMQGGMVAPAKRVGFFLPDNGTGTLNTNGTTLLKAAINHAMSR